MRSRLGKFEPFFALCLFAPFVWFIGLFDLDEGFYGSVVFEMAHRHDWITPYYNGHPWLEKPILLYWLALPFYSVFGSVGLRIPSLLSALGVIGLMRQWGRGHLDSENGNLFAIGAGCSVLLMLCARMMLVDSVLLLCLTAAFFTFYDSLVGEPKKRLWTAFWLGLAVLTKGPVAVILFGLIAGVTYWREKDLRTAFRGYWLAGFAIFLVVVSTWYAPAYLANGKYFIDEFLIRQNLQRFTGGDEAHTIGWIGLVIYPLILLLGVFPFTHLAIKGWPRWSAPEQKPQRFLAIWALAVFAFFSISGAKLPHYVLPCVPPLVLLGVDAATKARSDAGKRWVWLNWVVNGIATAAFLAYYFLGGQSQIDHLAISHRNEPGEAVAFQMPRREKDLGTGQLKLRETSHPSLELNIQRPIHEIENFDDIVVIPGRLLIFTRPGRISERDWNAARAQGRESRLIEQTESYQLFELLPLNGLPGNANFQSARQDASTKSSP